MSIKDWLVERQRLTELLSQRPYDLILYLERADAYTQLEYHDLAAGDAHKALLLTDEVRNEAEEYHNEAESQLTEHLAHYRERIHVDGFAERCACVHEAPRPRYVPRGALVSTAAEGAMGLDRGQDGKDSAAGCTFRSHEKRTTHTLEGLLEHKTVRCYVILARSLWECGCVSSALDFCERGLATAPTSVALRAIRSLIAPNRAADPGLDEHNPAKLEDTKSGYDGAQPTAEERNLPEQGFARREVYPWNDHEPDRYSSETLKMLNEELMKVAPKCEVRATSLPLLAGSVLSRPDQNSGTLGTSTTRPITVGNATQTSTQLGLFAKEDISPGELFLRERSALTATTELYELLCDACGKPMEPARTSSNGARSASHQLFSRLALDGDEEKDDEPDSSVLASGTVLGSGPVRCPECIDTLFCSDGCLELAQNTYHAAVCGKEGSQANLEAIIAMDIPAAQVTDTLYTLLLGRALAMALAQDTHPLELWEVKYIWGDFSAPSQSRPSSNAGSEDSSHRYLPFSFNSNIALPLHILQALDVDIFDSLSTLSDTWIFNTVFAKLRGTASAKISAANSSTRPTIPAVSGVSSAGHDSCSVGRETAVGQFLDSTYQDSVSRNVDNTLEDPDNFHIRLLAPREGLPNVAAVHPLWCLANHDCSPNVEWEWDDGEMRFWARDAQTDGGKDGVASKATRTPGNDHDASAPHHQRQQRGAEVKAEDDDAGSNNAVAIGRGQEILSHYCDISLPYRERREWMMGCLGGACRCERCEREEQHELGRRPESTRQQPSN